MSRAPARTWVWLLSAIVGFAASVGVSVPAALAACPKVLFFGSPGFSDLDAQFWQKVGIDGFFVKDVVTNWQDSPGSDEHSQVYRAAKQFQDTYSRAGIDQNFIKISVHGNNDHPNQVNLADAAALDRIVANFRDTARLARYAGLKGIAIDLEEHGGLWKVDPGMPNKEQRLTEIGKRIGAAIKQEYPEATLIVLPEVLVFARRGATQRPYALVPFFWNGLIQAHFNQLVIACERTYHYPKPSVIMEQTQRIYSASLAENGVNPATASIALGLWPIGTKKKKKEKGMVAEEMVAGGETGFALEPANAFDQRLQMAAALNQPYVWIYTQTRAWQDPQALEFQQAIQRIKRSCGR